jgi:hypothetical protein
VNATDADLQAAVDRAANLSAQLQQCAAERASARQMFVVMTDQCANLAAAIHQAVNEIGSGDPDAALATLRGALTVLGPQAAADLEQQRRDPERGLTRADVEHHDHAGGWG